MPSYRFLNFELNEENFSLTREGQRVALEPKALLVLILLVSRAGHLVDKHARAFRREVTEIEPDALRVLTTYRWPGNVRELENAVERAVALAKSALITS